MNSSSPPRAPDPQLLIGQQTQQNQQTAQANQRGSMISQTTPFGNLDYTADPSAPGGFRATQTLSPEDTAALARQRRFNEMTDNLAIQQTGQLTGLLSHPLNLNNEATEARLMQLGRARLDPMMNQRENSLNARLANQGITMGSEAWNRAQTQEGQNRNDAYNQLLLTGRGQAVSEALQERNQPINEITALLGAQQIQQPNFVNTPQYQQANTDVAGIQQQAYQNQADLWRQRQQSSDARFGALAGVAGSALGGWMRSDRRVKTDIEAIGEGWGGLTVYAFRYRDGGPRQAGYMADEVERVAPHAVAERDGVKWVNYDAVGGQP